MRRGAAAGGTSRREVMEVSRRRNDPGARAGEGEKREDAGGGSPGSRGVVADWGVGGVPLGALRGGEALGVAHVFPLLLLEVFLLGLLAAEPARHCRERAYDSASIDRGAREGGAAARPSGRASGEGAAARAGAHGRGPNPAGTRSARDEACARCSGARARGRDGGSRRRGPPAGSRTRRGAVRRGRHPRVQFLKFAFAQSAHVEPDVQQSKRTCTLGKDSLTLGLVSTRGMYGE